MNDKWIRKKYAYFYEVIRTIDEMHLSREFTMAGLAISDTETQTAYKDIKKLKSEGIFDGSMLDYICFISTLNIFLLWKDKINFYDVYLFQNSSGIPRDDLNWEEQKTLIENNIFHSLFQQKYNSDKIKLFIKHLAILASIFLEQQQIVGTRNTLRLFIKNPYYFFQQIDYNQYMDDVDDVREKFMIQYSFSEMFAGIRLIEYCSNNFISSENKKYFIEYVFKAMQNPEWKS